MATAVRQFKMLASAVLIAAGAASAQHEINIDVKYADGDFLKKYKTYESFIEHGDNAHRIALIPSATVKDFEWLSFDMDEDADYHVGEVLYSLKELHPQKPLVVSWVEVGVMSVFGFSYRDRDGQKKYFIGRAANYGGEEEGEEEVFGGFAVGQFFPPPPLKGAFSVQIMAGGDIDTVIREKAKAETAVRQPVFIVWVKPLYKLYVGDFNTRAEAQAVLPEAKAAGYKDAWITGTKAIQEKAAAVKRAKEAEKAAEKAEEDAKRALERLPKFTDSRDGKVYRKAKIGVQTWMAENLIYEAKGSMCYAAACDKYGSLYDWETAKTACPAGWHLPTDDEWKALENAAGGRGTAGKKLKSTAGWKDVGAIEGGNGTNDFGFSARPCGQGSTSSGVIEVGDDGYWWTATEYNAGEAYLRRMSYINDKVSGNIYVKKRMYSVRCVQD